MGEKLVLNAREAAAALGISLPSFYVLAGRPDFPCVRVGRRLLIPVEGLREWLRQEAAR